MNVQATRIERLEGQRVLELLRRGSQAEQNAQATISFCRITSYWIPGRVFGQAAAYYSPCMNLWDTTRYIYIYIYIHSYVCYEIVAVDAQTRLQPEWPDNTGKG